MANGMIRLLRLDHGYSSGEVLAMRVELPRTSSEPPRPSTEFVQRVLSTATRVPGVVAAGAMLGSPLELTLYGGMYEVEGFPHEWMREGAETGAGVCCTQSHRVSADAFDVLGVPVLRGRAFTEGDGAASPRVAVINGRLARKFPPGLDPVGHWLVNYSDSADRRLIVGVVGDTRDLSIEFEAPQAIYLPIEERGAAAMTVFLRTTGDARALAGAAQRAFRDQAGPVVMSNVTTLREMVLGSVSRHRLNAWLFGSFGVIGLLLSSVGIAGVVAYAVAHRTREIGVRLALGASPAGVRRLVTRQALLPVAIGLAIGLAGAFGLSRYVESLLFDVPPTDATSYAVVCVVLATVAFVAAYLPARRAARIDPLLALRAEWGEHLERRSLDPHVTIRPR
jgi:putative ABC transport system permease protein